MPLGVKAQNDNKSLKRQARCGIREPQGINTNYKWSINGHQRSTASGTGLNPLWDIPCTLR